MCEKLSIGNRQAGSAEAVDSGKPRRRLEALEKSCGDGVAGRGSSVCSEGFEMGPLVCPESRHGSLPIGRKSLK